MEGSDYDFVSGLAQVQDFTKRLDDIKYAMEFTSNPEGLDFPLDIPPDVITHLGYTFLDIGNYMKAMLAEKAFLAESID